MRISYYIILITFSFIKILSAEENNYYLILKNNKVNVRYGPGFDYPIKFVYNKKNLPVKVIDKKENFRRIIDFKNNKFLENLSKSKDENFYGERQLYTNIETLGKIKPKAIKVDKNNSAEIYRFENFNIVEFTTKANTLDYDSMDCLKKATDKPLIIINESMQFSAGVNFVISFPSISIFPEKIFVKP